MKNLHNYETDIQRCSKCGLCMSVCPVYKATGNDCAVSRGKFIMLNGVLKNDLLLSKNINKYLDMCLKCNACKDFCPSEIDAKEIFISAKCEYARKRPFTRFLKCSLNSFLPLAGCLTMFYRHAKFSKITTIFRPILNNILGRKILLASSLVEKNNSDLKICEWKANLKRKKVVYFKGCVNNYINPQSSIIVQKILKKMNVEIIIPKFKCCGAPLLSEGDENGFISQAEYNISQIPDDFDYFLTDCATCQSTFKDYEKYIDSDKLREINKKSMNVAEFIVKNVEKFKFNKQISFTYHKPCHLENTSFIKEFLRKSENIIYIQMPEYDECCGFAGAFAVKNTKISEKISARKAHNATMTKADYILTSCPSCIMGLTQGLIANGNNEVKPLNFIELFDI